MKSTDQRWQDIGDQLKKHNFYKHPIFIKKKLEKLMTHFKKVFDCQRAIPSRHVGYYEIASD